MRTVPRRRFSTGYLDRICEAPNEFRSFEDHERLRHRDLAELTDEALTSEGRRARFRADLDHDRRSRAWFRDRVAAVETERRRRIDLLKADLRRSRGIR